MKILLIYANYKEQSFTSAVRDTIAYTFHQKGHEVVIRDLYEIKFNPVLSKKDLESIEKEIFPVDIMDEQKFIQWADFICFVYPIWWSGMPAILKGYIEEYLFKDTVLILLTEKLFQIKKQKNSYFQYWGLNNIYKNQASLDALNKMTEECIFGFSGMKTVVHKYFKSIKKASNKEK